MKAIHYIACDSKKYAREAEASAKNFRAFSEGCRFILYTDLKFQSPYFDEIRTIPNLIEGGKTSVEWAEGKRYFETKLRILSESSYEMNLYLDGDIQTFVSIDPLFSLLDRFDMAMAHDPWRTSRWSDALGIPDCFPEFNLGMLFYRKSTTSDFFSRWRRNYELYPQPHDQPAFRKTMWDRPVSYVTLPPEFNHRPRQFSREISPKILHGRGEGFLPEIEEYENRQLYL